MIIISKIRESKQIQVIIISVLAVCIVAGAAVGLFVIGGGKSPADITAGGSSPDNSTSSKVDNSNSGPIDNNSSTTSDPSAPNAEIGGNGSDDGWNHGGGNVPDEPFTEDIKLKNWYQGVDISKRPDFDPKNVAKAINNHVATMKPGDKAYVPYGKYKYIETINIINADNNLKDCQIVLDGIYSQPKTSTFDAMHIEGDNLRFMISKITNGITGNSFSTTRASGITIGSSIGSKYFFKQIVGFGYGMKFEPNKPGDSIKDNMVDFNFLNCAYPIYMKAKDGVDGRVVNTQFSGGRVRGKTGVTLEKGTAQTSPHQSNTFARVAWESIETYGINLQYGRRNLFYGNRFESVMGYQIIESADSSENRYFNSVDMQIDLIDIKSKNVRIDMPIYGCYPEADKQNYWQDLIRIYETDIYGRPKYTYIESGAQKAENANLDIKANTRDVIVDASAAAVTLKLHKLAVNMNLEMYIYVNDDSKGVQLVDSKGISINANLSKGTYKLTYDGKYRLKKISSSGTL